MPDGQAQAGPADPDGTSRVVIHIRANRHRFRDAVVNNRFISLAVDNRVDRFVNRDEIQ